MQRAPHNILMNENERKTEQRIDHNAVRKYHLHQFTRAEGTTQDKSHNQKKRHITQKVTVSRFHQRYIPLPILLTCSLVTSPLLTNAVYIIVRRRKNLPNHIEKCRAWLEYQLISTASQDIPTPSCQQSFLFSIFTSFDIPGPSPKYCSVDFKLRLQLVPHPNKIHWFSSHNEVVSVHETFQTSLGMTEQNA